MQATLLNTVTLNEFTDLVEKSFLPLMEQIKPMSKQIYIEEDLAAHTGESKRFDEVDVETFADRMNEGSNAAKASVGVGYNRTAEVQRVAKEIDITYNMRRYNKAAVVTGQLTALGHYCPNRMELDGTHQLTFCSSTSYTNKDGETVATTTGDGLAICYSAHTLKFSSTTYRNRVANDPFFSQAALQAARKLFTTDIYNNFGDKRVMHPNTIIIGNTPDLEDNVMQVVRSSSDVDQNNPGVVNVNKTKFNILVLPWLTTTATGAHNSAKEQWWFLADIGRGIAGLQAYLGIWERPRLKTPPREGNNGENVHNDNWTYGARASFRHVFVTAKGLVGSLPST